MTSRPMVEPLPDPEYLPRHSLGERRAHGFDLRKRTPHERRAAWTPSRSRFDPVGVLERQGEERIQELLPPGSSPSYCS